MPPPRGLMVWPGIEQIEAGHFALLQGITPSVATLEILPQDPSTIPIDGTLSITFGDVEIDFPDCRIDRASFEYSPSGFVWRLSIWDRRWKWQFGGPAGPISGNYNQRFSTIQPAPQDFQLGSFQLGSIDPVTRRTPQQLAAALLLVMGETGFDVSQLPNTALPEVNWERDNPAQELQRLCDELGCRVVLGLDNLVRVCATGLGADLPTEDIEHESDVLDPPEIPDSIMVVGGKDRYQADFLLEAVGLDVDGTIKPIGQLSYAPDKKDKTGLGGFGSLLDFWDSEVGFREISGWEQEDIVPPLTPPRIAKVYLLGDNSNQVNPRYLARQSVWRWWRISVENGSADDRKKPPAIPGLGSIAGSRIKALWQILPLEDVQILGWYDNTNNFVPYEAKVYGRYFSPAWNGLLGVGPPIQDAQFNFTVNTAVACEYQVDKERGIVMFDEPLVFIKADNTAVQPFLYLRCTVSVRDFDTYAFIEYQRTRNLSDSLGLGTGSHNTGSRIIKRPEIIRQVVPQYDQKFKATAIFSTDSVNDAEADQAIDAALLEYQVKTPQVCNYMGIVPISPDGAITQVEWSVGPQGATTRAARNTEVNYAIPPFRERALAALLPAQGATVKRLQDQARRG